MAKVLYITANPGSEEQSFSLSIGRSFLNAYSASNAQDEIVELDLYNLDIPLIDADVLGAWGALRSGGSPDSLSGEQQRKLAALDGIIEQFISADKYIFVTPLWNLSIPPMMKAYIDAIVIAGKTFTYTEQGPSGLLNGKKGIHIQARGGIYSGDLAALEFGDAYLKTIMGFIGVEMLDCIVAEGMAYNPAQSEEIKLSAIVLGQEAAKSFAAAAV